MKTTFFRYSLILITCTMITTGCQQAATSDKASTTLPPRYRNIKNGAQYAEDVNSGKTQKDDFIGSPVRTASINVAGCRIGIRYSSPGVKGREIWGKLVPYDKVWVTGANHATAITFNQPIKIDGKKVLAGTYGVFTIPGKNDWVVILNKDADQHLTDDYSKEEDVLRFTVKPVKLPSPVQRLTYRIVKKDTISAEVSMAWEKRGIGFVVHTLKLK
jgi:hypothetical protein